MGFANAAHAAAECDAPLADIIRVHDFGLAYYCSELRLKDHPEDVDALLVAARAAQELGQLDIALELSQKSRQYPLTKSQKFASYLISGIAAAGNGDALTSKLFLRRSANLVQNDVESGIVRAAMNRVRAQSPWSYGLSFNVTPSTNINGGQIEVNNGESDDSIAAPGIGYSLNLNVTHRTRLSTRLMWENQLLASSNTYDGPGQNSYKYGFKSSLRYAPSSDISTMWIASIHAEDRHIANEIGGPAFGVYVPYYSQTSFRLERHVRKDASHSMMFYGTYTWRDYETGLDAEIFQAGLSFGFPITDNVTATLSGYWEDTVSLRLGVAKQSENVAIGLQMDLERLPISLSGRLSYTNTTYKIPYLTTGLVFRSDETAALDVGLTPKNLQWFGFRPTFGVTMSRSYSNIERFDTFEANAYTRISSVF